jgi:hypothetical protein
MSIALGFFGLILCFDLCFEAFMIFVRVSALFGAYFNLFPGIEVRG